MLKKVSLFKNKRDFFHFLLLAFTIFSLSISLEFYNYKEFTKFDSQLLNATIIKQYTKTKLTKTGKTKSYQVLKIKSDAGFTFYTTASKNLSDIKFHRVQLEAWAGDISFSEYMYGFFCFTKIVKIYDDDSYKTKLNTFIDSQHTDKDISLIYQALFTAKQLPYELQKVFSTLGVSHLIAISGFHLGILTTLLYFLLQYPYKFFQSRYFPYRSYKIDSFFIIGFFLLDYLLFLGSPPSLLRAFVMFLIGFILYDREIKILSMQTLFLSVIILLSLFPRLFFSLGFFLSVAGVFYIFLFLIYFKNLSKIWQFIIMPIWIYILMLPYSLFIFGNFSLYHPLSILLTSLFTLFYPISILLHIVGFGSSLDFLLLKMIDASLLSIDFHYESSSLYLYIIISLLAIFNKYLLYPLFCFSIYILIYSLSKL